MCELCKLCLPSRWDGLQAVAHAADGEAGLKLPSVLDGEALAASAAEDQRAKVDFTGRCDFVPEYEDAMNIEMNSECRFNLLICFELEFNQEKNSSYTIQIHQVIKMTINEFRIFINVHIL